MTPHFLPSLPQHFQVHLILCVVLLSQSPKCCMSKYLQILGDASSSTSVCPPVLSTGPYPLLQPAGRFATLRLRALTIDGCPASCPPIPRGACFAHQLPALLLLEVKNEVPMPRPPLAPLSPCTNPQQRKLHVYESFSSLTFFVFCFSGLLLL